jgi:hypothetical protein
MDKKNILTYQGLKKLEDELQELKVVRRKEVAAKIKEAREQGDLSENAEYDAAKDEQRDIEARIEDIEKILKQLEEIQQKWGIDPSYRFEIEGLAPSNEFLKDKEKKYEDILKEIDDEVNNINKVIQPQYQALQSGASGKMIYGTIKLSELKRSILSEKIGIIKALTPKKAEGEGELQLSQAMLDEIAKRFKK